MWVAIDRSEARIGLHQIDHRVLITVREVSELWRPPASDELQIDLGNGVDKRAARVVALERELTRADISRRRRSRM
jgi:hypothetical protein